jgi:hypothetical protein
MWKIAELIFGRTKSAKTPTEKGRGNEKHLGNGAKPADAIKIPS